MLACTFVHNKFPNRAAQGKALLRCFFSSARMPELPSQGEQALKALARKELKEIVGLNAEPEFALAFRWQYGLPQYEIGHLERTAKIEAELNQMPGLHLIGNSLHGIGVPDCIRSAKQAAQQITANELAEDC